MRIIWRNGKNTQKNKAKQKQERHIRKTKITKSQIKNHVNDDVADGANVNFLEPAVVNFFICLSVIIHCSESFQAYMRIILYFEKLRNILV